MLSADAPISMLRQYLYCPRIPHFILLRGLDPRRPAWVAQGIRAHIYQTRLFQRRTLVRFGLERAQRFPDVPLFSRRLMLHGRCDLILVTQDSLVPVEFKPLETVVRETHRIQAAAYGMAAEEQWRKPCHRVFILLGSKGKAVPVPLSETLRQKTMDTALALHRMLETGHLPFSPAPLSKCGQCEFLNFCNDRE